MNLKAQLDHYTDPKYGWESYGIWHLLIWKAALPFRIYVITSQWASQKAHAGCSFKAVFLKSDVPSRPFRDLLVQATTGIWIALPLFGLLVYLVQYSVKTPF